MGLSSPFYREIEEEEGTNETLPFLPFFHFLREPSNCPFNNTCWKLWSEEVGRVYGIYCLMLINTSK